MNKDTDLYGLIRNDVFKLPLSDQMQFTESLFNGFVTTMRAFHLLNGKTAEETDDIIASEIEGISSLITSRLEAVGSVEEAEYETEKDKSEPTDESFEWDAKLDFMNLITAIEGKSK